jgi:hypothetical protein
MDAYVELAAGLDRPANLRIGGLVGPHGIENDVDRHGSAGLLLSLLE